jgi:hypothetical protein
MTTPPRRKACALLLSFAVLMLGLGSGAIYAFTDLADAGRLAMSAGPDFTMAGLLGLSLLWRGKKDASVEAAQPEADQDATSGMNAPPEPVRAAQPEAELIKLDGPCIDDATLESLRKLGGEDFVKEVMSQFISEGVLTMFKVAQAVSDGDSVEYGAQVHALRSSAANVGARRLYKLCLEWRELTRDELVASGSSRFVQLQGEFSAAERALRERHDYTDRAHPKSAVAAMARAG